MVKIQRTRWTTGDVRILKEHYPGKPIKEIVPMLRICRSDEAVRYMAFRLGLTKGIKRKRWNTDEMQFLINNCDKIAGKEIAKELNRSYESIYAMKHRIKNGKYNA